MPLSMQYPPSNTHNSNYLQPQRHWPTDQRRATRDYRHKASEHAHLAACQTATIRMKQRNNHLDSTIITNISTNRNKKQDNCAPRMDSTRQKHDPMTMPETQSHERKRQLNRTTDITFIKQHSKTQQFQAIEKIAETISGRTRTACKVSPCIHHILNPDTLPIPSFLSNATTIVPFFTWRNTNAITTTSQCIFWYLIHLPTYSTDQETSRHAPRHEQRLSHYEKPTYTEWTLNLQSRNHSRQERQRLNIGQDPLIEVNTTNSSQDRQRTSTTKSHGYNIRAFQDEYNTGQTFTQVIATTQLTLLAHNYHQNSNSTLLTLFWWLYGNKGNTTKIAKHLTRHLDFNVKRPSSTWRARTHSTLIHPEYYWSVTPQHYISCTYHTVTSLPMVSLRKKL